MATRLAATAARQTLAANRDALERPGRPEVGPISLDARPSEIIGQSLTNAVSPTISKLIDQTDTLNRLHPLYNANLSPNPNAPVSSENITPISSNQPDNQQFVSPDLSVAPQKPTPNWLGNLDNDLTRNSIIRLTEAFLGSQGSSKQPTSNLAFGSKQFQADNFKHPNTNGDLFPTIHQLAPGASSNFGIPKGEGKIFPFNIVEFFSNSLTTKWSTEVILGCVPFLSEFMQVLYGNCVKESDAKTWDLWGGQIFDALRGGKMDLLKASKETCKRGVERQQCGQLRRAISSCDILGSLQVTMEIQRAMKRCDEVTGLLDQNPMAVLNQINNVITGEVAQGFLHKFLG
ncbi:unnamed protein product [Anisakis simplex]|uniref:NACHT_N domain-containing protein n=1 Tax=Anisakis simplex TaxID=6269 RepID=A0A0M3K193_ANISI|nr:unnamed protein product [Anisakis simplex]